ncbi:type VI secretion system baseplate subunit TssG [Salmonella enterica]|uniref:type VI secretion system baseplate subunit TssG n=1 Tax=Salmonella enterica TaxID=28901 RepID=UPI000B8A6AB5|nr:type VI secretion system baseplate subunit TssG [Salmonella enterica]OXM29452.1 type VI secretion protein [Salmonella enterica subsp. enterica serovar Weslaco]
MDRTSQPARTGLTERLAADISRINFYRFCQLLEQNAPQTPALGSTANPADDPVRFRPHPGMGFPVSELKAVENDPEQASLPTVRTTFLGLYGVDSPLPTAYLDYITQRQDGHEALTAFLDIFNHRFITQYYRIWRKYNYPASFEAGAVDNISRCLLGLIGLGIPGSENHIATPVSRFLALLSVMRLPTRTAEGITALVGLLAPLTKATVIPHDPRPVVLSEPSGLFTASRIGLKTRALLGKSGTDVNSQLLLKLYTEDADEARGWLPGGQLHTDLLVLLRVYLGWRCQARLQLTLPVSLLPPAQLGKQRVQISRTGILRASFATPATETVTVNLGRYQGLMPASSTRNRESITHVSYSF